MFGWFKKKKSSGASFPQVAPPPLVPTGPMDEAALEKRMRRSCAPLVFRKPASIDPFETMFGAVRLAQRGEAWPECNGVPMWPLLQINVKAAPMVPKGLSDLALLTIFISPEASRAPTQIIDTSNPDAGETWALRSYPLLSGLTIPQAPDHKSTLSARGGEWGAVTPDYPNHDNAGAVIDTQANDVYAFEWARGVYQTKLGGWPSTVQSEPWWDYTKSDDTWDYVLQIENEPKAGWHGWGDGCAFIARSRERPHMWAIDVQFT